jgi:hypothetical protein
MPYIPAAMRGAYVKLGGGAIPAPAAVWWRPSGDDGGEETLVRACLLSASYLSSCDAMISSMWLERSRSRSVNFPSSSLTALTDTRGPRGPVGDDVGGLVLPLGDLTLPLRVALPAGGDLTLLLMLWRTVGCVSRCRSPLLAEAGCIKDVDSDSLPLRWLPLLSSVDRP